MNTTWDIAVLSDEIEKLLESPLERKLLVAFLGDWAFHCEGDCVRCGSLTITPQAKIGPFRTDFYVSRSFGVRSAGVAVEVDGHEFHEKTSEQATRDHRRDRAFVRMGVVVLRFTGSEIAQNPKGCADEVEQLLMQWLMRASELWAQVSK